MSMKLKLYSPTANAIFNQNNMRIRAGDKVVLSDYVNTSDQSKLNWIRKQVPHRVYTVKKPSFSKGYIFCLKEDNTTPKLLFDRYELVLVKRSFVSTIVHIIKKNFYTIKHVNNMEDL